MKIFQKIAPPPPPPPVTDIKKIADLEKLSYSAACPSQAYAHRFPRRDDTKSWRWTAPTAACRSPCTVGGCWQMPSRPVLDRECVRYKAWTTRPYLWTPGKGPLLSSCARAGSMWRRFVSDWVHGAPVTQPAAGIARCPRTHTLLHTHSHMPLHTAGRPHWDLSTAAHIQKKKKKMLEWVINIIQRSDEKDQQRFLHESTTLTCTVTQIYVNKSTDFLTLLGAIY